MLILPEFHDWSRNNPEQYCEYVGTGRLQFDPGIGTKHFDPWWLLLVTDQDVTKYYAWLCKRHGRPVSLATHWGAHVSVVRGDEPPNKDFWGKEFPEVSFRYTNYVRSDNGCHAWLDVFSPELSEVRQKLGLSAKEWYHLTLGRLM